MIDPKLVADKSMNVTIIWYLMARTGLTPAKIKPDIIPGRLTRPTVFAESMVGDIPVTVSYTHLTLPTILRV